MSIKKSIITGIKQWGENQFLILGYLGGNIKELPIEHTKKSFSNIMSFRRTFMNCKDLTFIPDDLFTNCINVQYFTEVFEGCENLENIPANLFVDLKNCKGFERAFKNCINLKGTVYPIWEDENIKGDDCFLNCTKLNNYNEIPEIWK